MNGLAVIIDQGAYSFGTPTAISATVAPGTEGIVNIEHEAGLSGEITTKASLIRGIPAQALRPLLPSSIYAGIASRAVLRGSRWRQRFLQRALRPAFGNGELEIRQDIAVTGSVNQMGEIQPVGGINEKIEGFFPHLPFFGPHLKTGAHHPYQNVHKPDFLTRSSGDQGSDVLHLSDQNDRRRDADSHRPAERCAKRQGQLERRKLQLRYRKPVEADVSGGTVGKKLILSNKPAV